MPRGVYERKPRTDVGVSVAAPLPEPPACVTLVHELHASRSARVIADVFERCKGELGAVSPAERRAVLGALAGWFNDGKYD